MSTRSIKSGISSIGKREILREMQKVQRVATTHTRLSRILAVELFRVAPTHPVFSDDTFSSSSLDTIRLDAKVFDTYDKLRGAR